MIAVRVNHADPSSRWYAGSGIIRPVTLQTSCGRFTVFQSGRVVAAPVPFQPAWPLRAPAGPGAWAEIRDGRVVFVRGGDVVWRSAARYDPQSLGATLLSPSWVSFSIYSTVGGLSDLYVASLDGVERRVGGTEDPVAIAASGLIIASRWRPDGSSPDLVLLRVDGRLIRLIAARVRFSSVDHDGRTVLFVNRGALWRTDGDRSWVVMSRRTLGLHKTTSFDQMDDVERDVVANVPEWTR